MLPFVVPRTTPPWIWPSNGKILRVPYQKFLILNTYGGFRHVYMTNSSYFYIRWVKAWGSMIFHWCFDYDGWWLTLHIFVLIPWVNWWLNILSLDVFWWHGHFLTHLSYHLPLISILSGSPLSTLFTLLINFSPFKG